jgi:hypothetical protein
MFLLILIALSSGRRIPTLPESPNKGFTVFVFLEPFERLLFRFGDNPRNLFIQPVLVIGCFGVSDQKGQNQQIDEKKQSRGSGLGSRVNQAFRNHKADKCYQVSSAVGTVCFAIHAFPKRR